MPGVNLNPTGQGGNFTVTFMNLDFNTTYGMSASFLRLYK